MPHECCPSRLQRTRTTHRVVHSPASRCTPPPARPRPAASTPGVCSVPTRRRPRDAPSPGARGCVRGARPHRLVAPR
eukprot:3412597-Prymnesium_polylepis.1